MKPLIVRCTNRSAAPVQEGRAYWPRKCQKDSGASGLGGLGIAGKATEPASPSDPLRQREGTALQPRGLLQRASQGGHTLAAEPWGPKASDLFLLR